MAKEQRAITVHPYGDMWRATIPVSNPDFVRMPGVIGHMSDSGPWIGAEGADPADAIRELYVAIGRAILVKLLSSDDADDDADPEVKP